MKRTDLDFMEGVGLGGVFPGDLLLTDAFCPGGAQVVLPDDIQHGRAGDTREGAGLSGAQRKGGQDQMQGSPATAGGQTQGGEPHDQ